MGRRRQGLRTLAVATRLLGEDEYAEWDQRYQAAAAQLEGRDEALADLAGEVEAELELVGVTAIEDKLQAGVPEAIQTLLDAGVKARARGGSNSNRRLCTALSPRCLTQVAVWCSLHQLVMPACCMHALQPLSCV